MVRLAKYTVEPDCAVLANTTPSDSALRCPCPISALLAFRPIFSDLAVIGPHSSPRAPGCGNLAADMKLSPKLAKTLLELLAACLLLVFMFRWFEHSQVYHPDRVMTATGAELSRPFEDVFFKASDGAELNGWFFPADTNSPRRHLVVLVCHGNAGNISHRLDTYAAILATGVNVFAFDYRGFGRSRGQPSEEGTYRDAQAAYEWLRQKGFAGTSIVAFGGSLGGGVAAELAVRETGRRAGVAKHVHERHGYGRGNVPLAAGALVQHHPL